MIENGVVWILKVHCACAWHHFKCFIQFKFKTKRNQISIKILSVMDNCSYATLSSINHHRSTLPEMSPEQQKLLIEIRKRKQELLLEMHIKNIFKMIWCGHPIEELQG